MPATVEAPAEVAAVTAGAAIAAVAAGVAALNCTPNTCSSDCSILLNRFCAAPTGICAAVSLLESSEIPRCEPFLWPCRWRLPGGTAEGAELKFAIDDIRVSLRFGVAKSFTHANLWMGSSGSDLPRAAAKRPCVAARG